MVTLPRMFVLSEYLTSQKMFSIAYLFGFIFIFIWRRSATPLLRLRCSCRCSRPITKTCLTTSKNQSITDNCETSYSYFDGLYRTNYVSK